MHDFDFAGEVLSLPRGAWARTERRVLRWRDRVIVGFTTGAFRPYLFPVYSPSGTLVTTESPADHPHHSSLWIGADHVHALVPAADGAHESYAYNFYVNEVFQGRAPGRIVEDAIHGMQIDARRYRVTQALRWQGPIEWAAPEGRTLLRETRTVDVCVEREQHVIDVASTLNPQQWAVTLGPTRHAFFNFRVAEPMRVLSGGRLRGAGDLDGASVLAGSSARWVDCSGPVGNGRRAGVALGMTVPRDHCWWYASDWGVATVGTFRHAPLSVPQEGSVRFCARYVVHDGDPDAAALDALYAARDGSLQ